MVSNIVKFLFPVLFVFLIFFSGYKVWQNFIAPRFSSAEVLEETTLATDESDNKKNESAEPKEPQNIEIPTEVIEASEEIKVSESTSIATAKDFASQDNLIVPTPAPEEASSDIQEPVVLEPEISSRDQEKETFVEEDDFEVLERAEGGSEGGAEEAFVIEEGAFEILEPNKEPFYAEPEEREFDQYVYSASMRMSGKTYQLEHAQTEAQRTKGLMNRASMPKDQGMIFSFPRADRYGFWMKNTLIPLDLVWLDSDFRIVDYRTLYPCKETGRCPSFYPQDKALYVVELNAGVFDAQIGDILEVKFEK